MNQAEITDYIFSLNEFIAKYSLPPLWFVVPDHLAVKGRDNAHYEQITEAYRPLAKQLSYIELDNRRLATAELAEPLPIANFGEVLWIEIMEPRPERVGSDVVGLEHMEFLYPDFEAVKAELNLKKVAFEMQSNPNHEWINITINKHGQELKITNRPLEATVREELESGQSKIL